MKGKLFFSLIIKICVLICTYCHVVAGTIKNGLSLRSYIIKLVQKLATLCFMVLYLRSNSFIIFFDIFIPSM